MSRYPMIPLSEIFDLQMGKTPSRSNPDYWENGEYKWISISDLSKSEKFVCHTKERISKRAVAESGIKVVPSHTVVMSFKLSIGKTAITSEPMYTNEAIMAFHDRGKYPVDIDYIYHLFSRWDWSEGTNKAVMGATLNKATLQDIAIPLPPIDKQKEIATALDAVSEVLRLRKAQLAELDNLVKSQFIEMFGEVGHTQYEVSSIGKECVLKNGTTFSQDAELPDGPILYAKVSDMNLPGNEMYIKKSKVYVMPETAGKAAISAGAVVFPKRGGAIGTNKKRILLEDTCVDLNIMGVIPGDRLTTEYLYGFFSSFDLASVADGSTIPQLNNRQIAPLEIVVPPMEEQARFGDFFRRVNDSKLSIQQSLDETQRLFDSLMAEYFED